MLPFDQFAGNLPPSSDLAPILPRDPIPPASQGQIGWAARVGLFWAGVVVPIECVLFGLLGMAAHSDRWQSGSPQLFAELLLAFPTIPVWPLMIYSMVCLVLLLIDFERWSHRLIVRWGIYSGVLLAMQYAAIVCGAFVGFGIEQIPAWIMMVIFGWIGGSLVVLLCRGVAYLEDRPSLSIGVGILLAIVCLSPLAILLMLFGAIWTSGAYAIVAIWLFRRPRAGAAQFELRQLFGICAWAAAYCASWRVSYAWMLLEYAKLPTEAAPKCYIATAAARGHGSIVHSAARRAGNGESFFVNDKVRYFKAAELALLCAAPRAHGILRAVYDRVGKSLAQRMQHSWQADLAYLSLKPAEWTVRLLLPQFARDTACQLWR